MYGEILFVGHVLVDFAFVFVDGPIAFLAVLAAVVEAFALGTGVREALPAK
jgi:hypothetical protein